MNQEIEHFDDIDWPRCYHNDHLECTKAEAGSEESREQWDAKAAHFARKKSRSDYIRQLIDILDLAPGESLFDMGCGSGTVAIPVAEAGHHVVAVDFSPGMLAELEKSAEEQGVMNQIEVFKRSWQEDWDGLPQADVAVSSRSFMTDDLAGGIAKLEGQATNRVILTCGAGDRPYRDARVYAAMGRTDKATVPPRELAVIANYLWSIGRYPRITYIEYPGVWHHDTREDLAQAIIKAHQPQNERQREALDAYVDEHAVYDEAKGWWTLDYTRQDRWAALVWPVTE